MSAVTSGLKVHIRWLIRRDIPEVLAIEGGSFAQKWSEEDFLTTLRSRNCIGMVAEQRGSYPNHDNPVVAFMVYELRKSSLEVLNFAVDPDCRRLGVGSALLAKLKSKLSAHRRNELLVHVRESNLPAQLFFRAGGLGAVAVERGFYEDTGEDAYRMAYYLAAEGE